MQVTAPSDDVVTYASQATVQALRYVSISASEIHGENYGKDRSISRYILKTRKSLRSSSVKEL